MRNIILTILLIITNISVANAADNPFFGESKKQFAVNIGAGIDCGFLIPPPARFVPFTLTHFQYSLPSTFFELPARYSLNIASVNGYGDKYGWDWNDYSTPMVFLSEDVILANGEKWYMGAGAGVGMQARENERLGAKLLFQFKILIGYNISEKFNAEIFMMHMSNGNTADENYSYAFYGMGLVYKF